ncbi:MAG TPA: DinB family protein [Stackebrandtia sp.]|jgi:uncharacterized damage-inducible protein DinB|uniref:DinB family protein n=1 Tax=Stackebrandtia sp. TaxID=2023065 RepID=UPI002D35E9DD|nr:DinB family protein [Stackebrandtia sp.]HZE37851.1 DinB family protein [Stackebrandtia sp.]
MTVERSEPSITANEREMLEGWLEYHRATLLLKCEGVAPERLSERAVGPSNLSLLGLVRHMVEVERHWFLGVMRGPWLDTGVYWTDDDPDGDFDNVDGADTDDAFAQFDKACQDARAVAADYDDLDALSVPTPKGKQFNLRWIYTHMIEEYARHNGHADLLRESIDGTTGD